MRASRPINLLAGALTCALIFTAAVARAADPLPSWNEGKGGKPIAINQHMGRRPIAAVGNSDGDFELFEWVTTAPVPGSG
jgi:hypothetical protein